MLHEWTTSLVVSTVRRLTEPSLLGLAFQGASLRTTRVFCLLTRPEMRLPRWQAPSPQLRTISLVDGSPYFNHRRRFGDRSERAIYLTEWDMMSHSASGLTRHHDGVTLWFPRKMIPLANPLTDQAWSSWDLNRLGTHELFKPRASCLRMRLFHQPGC